jgi:hypothetical protein
VSSSFPIIENEQPVIQNRSTLKEIVESSKNSTTLRWAKLNEVIQSGLLGTRNYFVHSINLKFSLLGLLSEEQVALEELKFAAIIEEFRFHSELKNLINLATRAVSWEDPYVPPYHKRAIVISLHKG